MIINPACWRKFANVLNLYLLLKTNPTGKKRRMQAFGRKKEIKHCIIIIYSNQLKDKFGTAENVRVSS